MATAQSTKILFSKKLKVTDIEKRLAIPTKIMSFLPSFNGGHAVHIQLVHDTKIWPIVCTVRRQGYSKPVFSVGWRKFVTGNKLNVGDRITLYKVQDGDGSSSHYRVEIEQPATSNQDCTFPSPTLPLNHGVNEIEFGNEHEQLPEVADESIKQEGANVAAETLVEDVHVTIKLPPAKVFGGTNISYEVESKAHLDTETKCFGGITKDIGMGEAEPPLVSPYMAKKEIDINFFGLSIEAMAYGYGHGSGTIDQLAAAGEAWCNTTVTDQSFSLDLVLRQPTPHVEQMNLDLTLAPPTACGV
ncbi:hypothetical protein V6N13_101547 [Hibiscus sabdariffa]|uniref:TF-B3 domain-containing protein n=1 Tax=Hibiscus sabdariffa TaxID=183260 RepID=A0ABR2QLP7_9ROSI